MPIPPAVALASLSIRDFRGIDRLDLDFRGPDGHPNPLVVLAGPNGSGKTAVLEAALIASGGHKMITGRRGPRAKRLGGAGGYEIRATLERDGRSTTTRDAAHTSPPTPDPPVPHWYFSSWRAPQLVGPVDVTVGRGGRKPAKTDANRLKNVKQILVNAATIERFTSRPMLPHPDGQYSRWIEKINDAWRDYYPEEAHAFAIDIVAPEDKGSGSFDLFLNLSEGRRLNVDLLSAGQLELFLFLASLVLNNDREGIVFIDEPELHLDPQWHRPILRSLLQLQPRAQLIVATHSPEIYDAAQSYERHFLVPEDDPRAWLWGPSGGVKSGA
jgi:hypothetical protein